MKIAFICYKTSMSRLDSLDKGIVYAISNNRFSGRLNTSWRWRSFQGFCCSQIKVFRELGSNRRETGWSLSTASVDF